MLRFAILVRQWFSGKMNGSHSFAPGSIPGWRNVFFVLLLRSPSTGASAPFSFSASLKQKINFPLSVPFNIPFSLSSFLSLSLSLFLSSPPFLLPLQTNPTHIPPSSALQRSNATVQWFSASVFSYFILSFASNTSVSLSGSLSLHHLHLTYSIINFFDYHQQYSLSTSLV